MGPEDRRPTTTLGKRNRRTTLIFGRATVKGWLREIRVQISLSLFYVCPNLIINNSELATGS